VLYGKVHDPRAAAERGYLDEVVEPDQVVARATEVAQELSALNSTAHAISKDLARGPVTADVRSRLAADIATLGPPTT
jgi:enoyl-CoA hydratase